MFSAHERLQKRHASSADVLLKKQRRLVWITSLPQRKATTRRSAERRSKVRSGLRTNKRMNARIFYLVPGDNMV